MGDLDASRNGCKNGCKNASIGFYGDGCQRSYVRLGLIKQQLRDKIAQLRVLLGGSIVAYAVG